MSIYAILAVGSFTKRKGRIERERDPAGQLYRGAPFGLNLFPRKKEREVATKRLGTILMAKKGIPEWLNSSLWSSSSSSSPSPLIPDDRPLRHPPAAATTTVAPSPPILERPSPSAISTAPAPPLPIRPPPKSEINDLQNGSGVDGPGSVTPAAEDVSRKTQVVAEVSHKLILFLSLSVHSFLFD